jgi:hypothetical protein
LSQRFIAHITEVVEMNKRSLALKVLATEALLVAGLGSLAFLYARSVETAPTQSPAPAVELPEPVKPEKDKQVLAEEYPKAKKIEELAKTVGFRQEVDLIVFVIDTSASMRDDRDDLRSSVNKILSRYKGRAFNVVNFADTADTSGEPTKNLDELKKRIEDARDLGGNENSYLALSSAADKAREKFKNPAIVLITDAAPNDEKSGSFSQVTMDQAAAALNMANAELHVWAGFDMTEYLSGGAASTTTLYPTLLSKVKGGGNIQLLRQANFDPSNLSK